MPNRNLAGFVICALIIIEIGTVASHWSEVKARRPDFAALYSSAKLFRHAEEPSFQVATQDPKAGSTENPTRVESGSGSGMRPDSLHPPFEILLFLPLSYLPYLTAYVAWLFCNIIMLWTVPILLWNELGFLKRDFHFIAVIYGSMFPVLVCLVQGQDAILLLLLLTLCYRALKSDRELLAGIILATALFKFQIVLPIAVLFIFWKKWKVLTGFACGATVAALTSLLLIGPQAALGYLKLVSRIGLQSASNSADDPTLMPNLRGLLLSLLRPVFSSDRLTLLVIALSALVFVLAIWWTAVHQNATLEVKFSFFVTVSAAISYHFFPHNATVILLPLLLAAKEIGDESLSSLWKRSLCIAALGFYLAPNLLPMRNSMPALSFAILLLASLFFARPTWRASLNPEI
jgi:hypothetical protein